nr:NUDIX hydrolase [Corynebacterium glyciniphilum]
MTQKAVVYVIKDGRLLVFTHDGLPLTRTGVQVPAGTVKPGETLEAAARRELHEETGLHAAAVSYIGSQEYDLRPARDERAVRHYFRADVQSYPTHDSWSAGEDDPSGGGAPVSWTCWWLPLENAHVLCAGFGVLIGEAVRESL